jgi:hypothetical protein
MGKLSDDQARQLAELEAARDAPDPDDSDEISWYERGKDGERGATMKASRARSHGPGWLREALTDKDPDEGQAPDAAGAGDGGQAPGSASPTVRRFQRHAG